MRFLIFFFGIHTGYTPTLIRVATVSSENDTWSTVLSCDHERFIFSPCSSEGGIESPDHLICERHLARGQHRMTHLQEL